MSRATTWTSSTESPTTSNVIKNGEIVLEGDKDTVYENKQIIMDAGLDIPGGFRIKKLMEKYGIKDEI